MQVLDFSTSNSQVSDEVINVPNSNAVSLDHNMFYNKTGKLVVVRTASGGGGTLLTETTDYTVGDAFPDAQLPSSISPDVAYTTISIVNATYHNTDLYVSYYPIGDLITANRWNTDIPVQTVSITDDYTITEKNNNLFIKFTRQSTDKTLTMPDATANIGQVITVIVSGSAAGDLNYATISAQTLNGDAAATWSHEGEGRVTWVSDGANWESRDNGVWDSGSVADSGSDLNRVFAKYVNGDMIQHGEHDPGTYDINNSGGTNVKQSNIFTFNFGKSFSAIRSGSVVMDNPSLWVGPEFINVAFGRYRVMYGAILSSRTDDFFYTAFGTWK